MASSLAMSSSKALVGWLTASITSALRRRPFLGLAQYRRLRREQLVHPRPGGGDPVAEAERPDVDRLSGGFSGRRKQAEEVRVVALGHESFLAAVDAADDDAGPGGG
jgi:hypothetical protein